jgi:hypothetical protein
VPKLPALASSSATAKLPARSPASSSIPAHVVEVTQDKTPQPLVIDASIRAPSVAARELFAYVTELIRAGRGAELGSASEPNSTVQSAQVDMKRVAVNGVYDTATRARGKELIGREFPQRESKARVQATAATKPAATHATPATPATPATATPSQVLEAAPAAPPPPPNVKVAPHTPREAAEALLIYVSGPGANFGTKAAPSPIVRDAQGAMKNLTPDGIYGPKTAARIHALTGKQAPKRS